MRWHVVVFVLGSLVAAPATVAQFAPQETEICSGSASVKDPEYNDAAQLVTYYDGQARLKVARVLRDGAIAGDDCEGTLVDDAVTGLIPGFALGNGPEWGFSARGHEIYYTRLDVQGRPWLARAWFDRGWRSERLASGRDRGLPLVSTDAADAAPRLLYVRTWPGGHHVLAWRDASDPATEALVDATIGLGSASAPRWVPGERALSMARPDAGGVHQAYRHHVDAGTYQALTADAGHKDEVQMWAAPEFQGGQAMLTVVDGCCLRLYRDVGGAWAVVREIDAASFSALPGIYSPELLVHEGVSWVVMQLSSQRYSSSEIWIVAPLVPQAPPIRLSDPALPLRVLSEPEWVRTPGGVFVYATLGGRQAPPRLLRLQTPLQVR